MNIALIVLLPFIGAILPPLMIRAGRAICTTVTACTTLTSLALLLVQAPAVFRGEVPSARWEWLPQLGLDASFRIDGLAFLFAFLILFIGLLIILYARHYLSREDPVGRFFAFLLLFQGAMLGIVLSGNLLLLLVFWELTTLSSFLLIGYWRHLPEGRQGARMALAVTGLGGLALIGGVLLLGQIAGSFDLETVLAQGEAIKASPLYLPALVLVLLGAFTKSAQFPFHFWLPHAMAAPTPVSAYLHSATMVKAGIFLLARLWPAMAGTDAWFLAVSLTGLLTMGIAAWIALFKDDLKALLAFSTVSHLGLVTMLLGMGTKLAAMAGIFHIINHASFKAGLFMSAGIVDHETGTRDIRRLGGLAHVMPITATLAILATLSMAGIPPFNGFISKEMMLEEAAHTVYAGNDWLFPVLATLAALFSVAYSARFLFHGFLGETRGPLPSKPHDPPAGMWLPVAVLVALVVAIGLFPEQLAGGLVDVATAAVTGAPAPAYELALWHGVTPSLLMSGVAVAGGLVLLALYRPANNLREATPRPEAKRLFDGLIRVSVAAAAQLSDRLQNGSLQRYLAIMLVAAIAVGAVAFAGGVHLPGDRPIQPVTSTAVVLWVLLAGASLGALLLHRNRLMTLILTSLVGLVVSLAFLGLSAPDLALTQISVEVVTTILMLLALNLLPKETPRESGAGQRSRDLGIAVLAGAGVAAAAFAVMTRGFETISDFHLAQAKPGGGGTNVVNVILVDFRGYDTFGEIIVLGIAALAIFALLDRNLRGAAARRIATIGRVTESMDAHPLILVVATRVLLPLMLMVAAFIFLRGHNQPGGGFIAGLVAAIAFILQYVASGFAWARDRAHYDHHSMIGFGVLVAGLTGVAAWIFGQPFLTSAFTHVHLPLIGDVEIASAMAFDLGVFVTVLGVVVLALANLSRIQSLAQPEPVPAGPMDIVLEPPAGGETVETSASTVTAAGGRQ
ncbi:monovalent cation/H+ antiporter subunit A [Geminicoccaceae bacterium 1502E]|nr:monovalent cation/H+ antiporter subunit A [Geminicoccaceae bacterium 1502E]